jgi:ABC-type transport system substrate-binding protein
MNVASTRSRRRRAPLALLLTASTFLVAGVAAAYWSTTGGGSATAATGDTSPLTLTPATPTAQLYPGGQATVVLTVTNPNAGQVRVGSLALDTSQGTGGFAVDGGHSTCGLAPLSFATQTNGGVGWTVPGSGVLSVTLTNALSMGAGADNACQGAAFSVYLTAAS